MINLLYDGSFSGLLTAVFRAFRMEAACVNICAENTHVPDLFSEDILVYTDTESASRVLSAVRTKISPEAAGNAVKAFLSEEKGVENLILEYLRFGFKTGSRIEGHLADDRVLKIVKLSGKVAFEVHRFSGLVRFKELKDKTYYASIEPTHNILPLLGTHFRGRFADQDWVIHDVKRNKALIYAAGKLELAEISLKEEYRTTDDLLSDRELFYSEIWRSYCRDIAIKERKNLKLQMQHMPKKYWKHLTEMLPEK